MNHQDQMIQSSTFFDSMNASFYLDEDELSVSSLLSTSSADAFLSIIGEGPKKAPDEIFLCMDVDNSSAVADEGIEYTNDSGDALSHIDNVAARWGQPRMSQESLDVIYTSVPSVDSYFQSLETKAQASSVSVSASTSQRSPSDEDLSSMISEEEILESDAPTTTKQVDSTTAAAEASQVPTTILRILSYIQHTEKDRHVVYQAEEIVRDSQAQFQKGKKSYKNYLSGFVMKRLMKLFGVDRFHEIYHKSQEIQPPTYVHVLPSMPPPNTMQLAMAYGMHLARLNPQHDASTTALVQKGAESFQSMSNQERQYMWQYMTVTPYHNLRG